MSTTNTSQPISQPISRQQRRVQYLTNDPSGPQMRRLDLLLPKDTYEHFEAIMNNTNQRRREAIVRMIEETHKQMVDDGTIEPVHQHAANS